MRKSHSSIFSPYERHGTTAGILFQNDCHVTTRPGKILPAKSSLAARRMVGEDGTGKGQRWSKGLQNEHSLRVLFVFSLPFIR